MPAYNFKPQFIPLILSGSKFTTIRRIRHRRPTVAGDDLMLYTGMRTKSCSKIANAPCVETKPLIIYPFNNTIYFKDGMQEITGPALSDLMRADGLDENTFFRFFRLYKSHILDDFELIRWDPNQLKPYADRYYRCLGCGANLKGNQVEHEVFHKVISTDEEGVESVSSCGPVIEQK